jgi:hypothetical protein
VKSLIVVIKLPQLAQVVYPPADQEDEEKLNVEPLEIVNVMKKKTVTYRGPLCADKKFKASLHKEKPKNISTFIQDKPWRLLTDRPKIQTRLRYEKSGIKKLTTETVKKWLTVKLEHKENPETTMTIVFDPPADWNNKAEVQALTEDLAQTIRREAGTDAKKRADYDDEETDWIMKYFEPEDRKGYHGTAFWATMSKKMNEKFEGTKAMLKGGEESTEIRQHRKPNALMSKCNRDSSIMAVRGEVLRPKKARKPTIRGAVKAATMGNKDKTVGPEMYSLTDLKEGFGKYGAGKGYESDSSNKENIPPK